MENSLLYNISVTLLPGVGDVNAKKLVAYCGSSEAVFSEKSSTLSKIPGISEILVRKIKRSSVLKRAEEEIRFIEKNKIKPLFFLDEEYPKRLRNCNDSPAMLYYKGNATLNPQRVLAIVGTRKATEYGKNLTDQIVHHFAGSDTLVLSGLAYGIDVHAHRAALNHQLFTVGVLGHGLDRVYPPQHAAIARKMEEQGGVLTEFLSGSEPDKENFPKRNRIVAGMCDALVVVEAAITGGALITAEIASSYNRDVFAIPGRVNDEYSEGCNRLIFANKAALVQNAADIEYLMGWEENKPGQQSTQLHLFNNLSPEEESLVNLLKENGILGIDDLSILSKLPMSKASSTMVTLELNGIVKALPGKRYQLNY